MFGDQYKGARVLVTGHTGFKGAWLSLWLHRLGARVTGYALPAQTPLDLWHFLPPDVFENQWLADLRDAEKLRHAIESARPDLIIHMAAQPLVRLSYAQPLETFSVNAWGTALILETVRSIGLPSSAIIVTSDKCYRNSGESRAFTEDDPLGGHDVYSMSKAAAELVVAAWHASFYSRNEGLGSLATVRAGNVIGGGDYALDRIIPDCVRSKLDGTPVTLRNPNATRPWQHVLECLSGYLLVGQRLLGSPKQTDLLNLNFGPDPESERSVSDVVKGFFETWPGHWNISENAATLPEAQRLTLSHQRASDLLSWRPVWNFADSILHTAEWYLRRHSDSASDMLAFSIEQISIYSAQASHLGLGWAES